MSKNMKELYEKQIENQMTMIRKKMYKNISEDEDSLPKDNIDLFSYHIQQLISEIGELLDADKRWKNFRNEKYDDEHKLNELADCCIVLMNISIFSGYSAEELTNEIDSKMTEVRRRIENAV